MRSKYIVLGILNAVSLLVFAVFSVIASAVERSLPDQLAAERWAGGEMSCAQVSVFMDMTSPLDINGVFMTRVNTEKKLTEASIAPEREGARVWADAFSTSQRKISVSTDRATSDANLIATGGDFFLFHPFEIISGYYYSDDDLMHDRVLIDDVLAWQLYGSSDVAGKPVRVDGTYYIISGVFRQSENSDVERVYGMSPRIFMPYEGYSLMNSGEAVFTCYEACLPNKVTGQGKQIVTEALSAREDDPGLRIVENSVRYGLKNRFEIIADFGMRSVVDSPVVYPFWENAARISEDRSALLLVFQTVLLIFPVCTAVYLLHLLLKNRKKLIGKALNTLKRVPDRVRSSSNLRKSRKAAAKS
ncbi:MAG: ABC transporter permease [Oscillospiraceae bacterium]|nr:ABC transporter permease [Oscillospiraceae bacterium]